MAKKLAVVGLCVCIAFAVYTLVSTRLRVPPMPRVRITEDEQRQVAKALAERAGQLRPNAVDDALIALFYAKNRAEARTQTDPSAVPAAEKNVSAFREAATAFARNDRDRYLLLGDFLALRFDRLLSELLQKAKASGVQAVLDADRRLAAEIETTSGSFLSRARRQGIVGEHGELQAPRILPLVLYRVVWRSLGGVGIAVGFDPAEEKTYCDYVVAMFRKKSSEEERLKAIGRLRSLDSAYDHVLAEAIVLYESGKTREARVALQRAIDAGRSDAATRQFARALGR